MDVNCPVCGEPIDPDYFHEFAEEIGETYIEVARQFQRDGCTALSMKHNEIRDEETAAIAAAMFDLLGDDIDGAAAMLDDFGILE